MPPASPQPHNRVDWPLLAILAVTLGLRLWHIGTPLIDAHSWRQVTNADIARHFAEGSLNFLRPRVSWGGYDGVVGMEFPLLQWLTGLLWRLTGESHIVARVVAILFSVSGVAAFYGLATRLFGRPAGLASALLMAVSPSLVFFGRSFLSDTPMLTFMIAAVWAWDAYFERPSWRLALAGAMFTALAALVKLPAILVLAPIAGAAWRHRRWRALADGRAVLGVVAAVALTAAWYWHADRLFLETGLTQAVFRPSGTYPTSVAPGIAFTSVAHWTTAARFFSGDSWREFADRFWGLHLTPVGAAGALLGWWLVRGRPAAVVADMWALGGAALFVVSMEGQYWHQFHQLPILSPLMLYFGVAAAPLFDPTWVRSAVPGWRAAPAIVAVVTGVTIQSMRLSGVERQLFRTDNLQDWVIEAGSAVRTATEPQELVVTVEYEEAGANSPMLLYFAHRQGWSFDTRSIDAWEIEWLRTRLHASYFATANWSELERDKPEVTELLSGSFKEVELVGVPSTTRLFDLGQGR